MLRRAGARFGPFLADAYDVDLAGAFTATMDELAEALAAD